VMLAVLAAVTGIWKDVIRVLSSRRLILTMTLTATLLAGNWLLYIYATVTGRVTEASLGYYMMPLVNAVLATAVLGERLRPAHYPALALVGIGVALPFVIAGDFTWLAVALPVSFACYGLVRKLAPIDSLAGLTVETLLMVVPSGAYLAYHGFRGTGVYGPDWHLNGLLMSGGVVTVIPLLTFGLSVRRMPFLANSFIQFVSPTIQILIAVYWIGETIGPDRWAALGCVWAAVLIFLGDSLVQVWAKHRSVRETEPEPELPVVALVGTR
ncbi:MAG: EamA family transporter, partial [Fimbriiglobus sp.]